MKKLFCILILALASTLAYAQRPDQIELPCPAGSSPTWWGQSYNQSTGKYRQWQCVKQNGTVTQAITDSGNGGQVFNVKAYGATGDGTTDDTSSIQAAWSAAKAVNGTLFFPPGTYLLSTQLNKPMSFAGPDIRGAGPQATVLDYSGAAGTAAIDYIGGSGELSGIKISGFTIKGTGTQWGIELDGQDGVEVSNVKYQSLALGFVPANDTSGSFSEGDVCRNCSFDHTVTTAVRYLMGSGSNSFHGTGLLNSFINGDTSGDPLVVIDNGALPYDAPMTVDVWVNSNQTFFHNLGQPGGYPEAAFYGSIQLETGAHTLTMGDTNPVALGGNFYSFGSGYTLGTLAFYRQIAQNGASTYGIPQNYTYSTSVTTGANTVTPYPALLSWDNSRSVGVLLVVNIFGANYDYQYLLLLTHDPYGGAATVVQIANPRSLNTAGYGAPTFTSDTSDNLIITNASYPASGLTVQVGATPVGY